MAAPAQFEWDEAMADANVAKHGVSFEYAVGVFCDEDRFDFDASRTDDGEERRKVVGMIDGRVFVVVYTRRGAVYRVISARRANASEEKRYGGA